MDHILIHYEFTQSVWEEVRKSLGLARIWNQADVNICFSLLHRSMKKFQELLSFVNWELWKLRSTMIFQSASISMRRVVTCALSGFKEYTRSNIRLSPGDSRILTTEQIG